MALSSSVNWVIGESRELKKKRHFEFTPQKTVGRVTIWSVCVLAHQPSGFNWFGIPPDGGVTGELAAVMSGNEDITFSRHVRPCHWLAWRIKPLTLPPRAAILIEQRVYASACMCVCICVCWPWPLISPVQLIRIAIKKMEMYLWDNGSVGVWTRGLPERLWRGLPVI